jgi:hypothetical protein
MDPALATVIVAVITTVGGLVGVSIKEVKRLRVENREDHNIVVKKLEKVQEDHQIVLRKLNKVQDSVDHVSDRVDDHIEWHLRG